MDIVESIRRRVIKRKRDGLVRGSPRSKSEQPIACWERQDLLGRQLGVVHQGCVIGESRGVGRDGEDAIAGAKGEDGKRERDEGQERDDEDERKDKWAGEAKEALRLTLERGAGGALQSRGGGCAREGVERGEGGGGARAELRQAVERGGGGGGGGGHGGAGAVGSCSGSGKGRGDGGP